MTNLGNGLTSHPDADVYRLLKGSEFDELCRSIRDKGLWEPVVVHPEDGSIIDGRNRARACKAEGVQLETIEYDGDLDCILEYVELKNGDRRHDNFEQRVASAVEIEKRRAVKAKKRMSEGGQGKVTRPDLTGQARDEAGRSQGVSGSSVSRGKYVEQNGVPKLWEMFKDQSIPLPLAHAQAIAKQPELTQGQVIGLLERGLARTGAEALKMVRVSEEIDNAEAPTESDTTYDAPGLNGIAPADFRASTRSQGLIRRASEECGEHDIDTMIRGARDYDLPEVLENAQAVADWMTEVVRKVEEIA